MTTIQVQSPNNPAALLLRRVFQTLGISLLIRIAFIQVLPFVLTVANSFKCDAAVENRPIPFIPTFETVSCRDANGEFISADEQVQGLLFDPSVDGYNQILNSRLPRWLFNTAFLSDTVTLLRLLFDSVDYHFNQINRYLVLLCYYTSMVYTVKIYVWCYFCISLFYDDWNSTWCLLISNPFSHLI